MKTPRARSLFSMLILVILSFRSPGFSRSQDGIAIPKRIVPVIEIKGNGYDRGLQHGRQLKREIAEVYAKWKENLARSTKRNADSVIEDFLRSTNFKPAIVKWTPGMMDELKGLADGS